MIRSRRGSDYSIFIDINYRSLRNEMLYLFICAGMEIKDRVMLSTFAVSLLFLGQINAENVPATKVFILPIEPTMFNWTLKIGDDFSYRASLVNAPDLPKWVEYLYSKRHKTGFLYGVPPKDEKEFGIEIIGLNRRTYETRRRVIHLNVEEKPDAARNEVHIKIDNLNVEDFFDLYRMSRLLNIFKYKLWKESFFDLYFTFLTSAVSLGARLPLRPTEGEGVVVRLGSVAEFSNTLIELQKEVKPLWKLQSCPRDFKRTSVERIFRDEGFVLDWCTFRLIRGSDASKPTGHLHEAPMEPEFFREPLWSRPTKAEVSRRSYAGEFAYTILVPALVMILLVVLLSLILGYQREGTRDESDDFFDSVFIVCEDYFRSKRKSVTSEMTTSHFAGNPIRASSALRTFGPEPNGMSQSRTSSPQTTSNGVARPTPPPYSGIARTTVVDF